MKVELRRATVLCSKLKGERLDITQSSDSQGKKTRALGTEKFNATINP